MRIRLQPIIAGLLFLNQSAFTEPLTTIPEVLSLTAGEAEKEPEVRLEGVVTFSDPERGDRVPPGRRKRYLFLHRKPKLRIPV